MFDGRHLSLKKLRFLSAPHTFSLQLLQPLPEAGATAEKANFYNHTFFSSNSAPPMFFFPSTFFSISTNTPPPLPTFLLLLHRCLFLFLSPLLLILFPLHALLLLFSPLSIDVVLQRDHLLLQNLQALLEAPILQPHLLQLGPDTHTHTQISRLEFSGDRAVAAG